MQSLENFFNKINQIDNNIKLTMKLEKNNILPILDYFLVEENNGLKKEVFRKAKKFEVSSLLQCQSQGSIRCQHLDVLFSPPFWFDRMSF